MTTNKRVGERGDHLPERRVPFSSSSVRIKTDNQVLGSVFHATTRSSFYYFPDDSTTMVVIDTATFLHGNEWDKYINKRYAD